MKRPEVATYGWVGLAAGVCLYDFISTQTLSTGFDRYLEHPVKKVLAIGAVAATGAHLLNLYEHFGLEHLDPIDRLGKFVMGVIDERL